MSFGNKSGSRDPVLVCPKVSPVTKQSFKDEVDVNNILAKYARTGEAPVNVRAPMFGDFSNLPSFLEGQLLVQRVEENFLKLSPAVRNRFENSPAKLLAFLDDPLNRAEGVKLGIVDDKSAVKADLPVTVSDAPKAEPGGKAEGV